MSEQNKNFSLKSMLGSFYSRENTSIAVMVWIWGIILIALAVWSAYKFNKSQDIKEMITFSVIFVCSFIFIAVIKIFAWQVIHRTSIEKRIDKLEEIIKSK